MGPTLLGLPLVPGGVTAGECRRGCQAVTPARRVPAWARRGVTGLLCGERGILD